MMCLPLVLILLTCKTDAAPADSGGKLTFLEASNKCTGIGKQLPKAESAPEYEKLIVRMKEKALDTLWLRVQKNSFGPNTHKWLNGITFKETLSGPDYKGPPKECGIMETVYSKKDDAICYEKHGYICRLESCSSCDFLSPYECVRLGDICYRIYDFVSGWFTARNICEKEKGQLAVIPSEEDRKRLSALVHKHHQDQDKFFIGFSRIEFYYNIKGGRKEAKLHHWYIGEPSDKGDCVVMKRFPEGYYWASANCDETHYYICLQNEDKVTRDPDVLTTVLLAESHASSKHITGQKTTPFSNQDRIVVGDTPELFQETNEIWHMILSWYILGPAACLAYIAHYCYRSKVYKKMNIEMCGIKDQSEGESLMPQPSTNSPSSSRRTQSGAEGKTDEDPVDHETFSINDILRNITRVFKINKSTLENFCKTLD